MSNVSVSQADEVARNGSAVSDCPICASRLGPPILTGHDRVLPVPGEFAVRECSTCGLGVTEPRLDGKALGQHYPDAYWSYRPPTGRLRSLVAASRRLRTSYHVRFGPMRELLAGGPKRVLDIGCGRGDLAAWFTRRGWDVKGLDISAVAVQAATELGVDAIESTIANAPWPNGTFDVVIVNHTLEHLDDPLDALRRCEELLRPGGRLIVAVPDWGSRQRKLFGSRWYHLDLPRHLQHFDIRSLEGAVRRAGFTHIHAQTTVSLLGLPASVQYVLFGRWALSGRLLRPVLAVFVLMHPLIMLVGRLSGGDTLYLSATRSAHADHG